MAIPLGYVKAARCRFRDLSIKVQAPLARHLSDLRGETFGSRQHTTAAKLDPAVDELYRQLAESMHQEMDFDSAAAHKVEEHLCLEALWLRAAYPDRLWHSWAIIVSQPVEVPDLGLEASLTHAYWPKIAKTETKTIQADKAFANPRQDDRSVAHHEHSGLGFIRRYSDLLIEADPLRGATLARLLKAGALTNVLVEAASHAQDEILLHGFLFECQAKGILPELCRGLRGTETIEWAGWLEELADIPTEARSALRSAEAALAQDAAEPLRPGSTPCIKAADALSRLMLPYFLPAQI
jgi:hypothetical protein